MWTRATTATMAETNLAVNCIVDVCMFWRVWVEVGIEVAGGSRVKFGGRWWWLKRKRGKTGGLPLYITPEWGRG